MRRTMRSFAVIVLAAAFFFSCARAPHYNIKPDERIPWIRMHRGACKGTCPVYEVTIYPDGAVVFTGEKYTRERGRRKGRLEGGRMGGLQSALQSAVFLDQPEDCCNCRQTTDQPWVEIEVREGSLRKLIKHYHGCLSAPREITALEDRIDELAGTAQWVGTPEERQDQR